MLNCCEKLFLGEFLHSEEKEFEGMTADVAGTWTFFIRFLGVVRRIEVDFEENEPLVIPSHHYFNEDALFEMTIKDPNNEYYTYQYMQCFSFKTVIALMDCETCNTDIYGITVEDSIDDDPDFELGLFE